MNEFKKLSDRWDAKGEKLNFEGMEIPSVFALKALPYIQNNSFKTILELGAGQGRDMRLFSDNGLDVTAVDVSAYNVNHLRAHFPNAKIIHGDIKDISFPPASFDCIYARLSLHYFTDNDTTLIFERIFNILKPGGFFFAECKSLKDPKYGIGEKIEKDMYNDIYPLHFFSTDYFKEKAQKFNILELYGSSEKSMHFSNLIAQKL
jgi:ubiquinone/menaquinone biosynthesis C-methylase UbiE